MIEPWVTLLSRRVTEADQAGSSSPLLDDSFDFSGQLSGIGR
jgi:hypothetical protein